MAVFRPKSFSIRWRERVHLKAQATSVVDSQSSADGRRSAYRRDGFCGEVILKSRGARGRGRPPNTKEYAGSFVRRVHELIQLGFASLNAPSLATKHEEAITGHLVAAIRSIIDRASGKVSWASRFAVHEDPPVNTNAGATAKEGRSRPRIDIEIEQACQGPHPRFRVEAKRLHDSGSIAGYLGEGGLGALTSGYYGSMYREFGMLGYIQTSTRADWVEKVARALEEERSTHGVESVPAWISRLLGEIEVMVSTHKVKDFALDVYHTFLTCH